MERKNYLNIDMLWQSSHDGHHHITGRFHIRLRQAVALRPHFYQVPDTAAAIHGRYNTTSAGECHVNLRYFNREQYAGKTI